MTQSETEIENESCEVCDEEGMFMIRSWKQKSGAGVCFGGVLTKLEPGLTEMLEKGRSERVRFCMRVYVSPEIGW